MIKKKKGKKRKKKQQKIYFLSYSDNCIKENNITKLKKLKIQTIVVYFKP